MKKAFSILTAIFFVVLIATLGVLTLSLSTSASNQTADVYLKEQAELLAQGGTEYAIFKLLTHNFKVNGCLTTINMPQELANKKLIFSEKFPTNTDQYLFSVQAKVRYIGTLGNCSDSNSVINAMITDNNARGNVIIDVFVVSNPSTVNMPINFHRRTLQKL